MVYVDKTAYIKLLVDRYKYVFLSRPRRFGKSLFVSTLNEYFTGQQELFKGLAIAQDKNDIWESYPIVRFDFSSISSESAEKLSTTIINALIECGNTYGIAINGDADIEYLPDLVKKLFRKYNKPVVILIDEYDKPIVDNLFDIVKAEANREILRGFYSSIKSLDQYIKFMFVTGVSKFAKVSLFSGLNQITDISFDKSFAGICGYTQEEFQKEFSDRMGHLAESFQMDNLEIMEVIKEQYNGYSWDGETRVYNPVSILNLFDSGNFGNFWYQTGTPKFLVSLIKQEKYDIADTSNFIATTDSFNSEELGSINLKSLLFQTGYLTIKKRKRIGLRAYYELGFPNLEVKESFYQYLFADMVSTNADVIGMNFTKSTIDIKIEDKQY
jgi:hypothetical protein